MLGLRLLWHQRINIKTNYNQFQLNNYKSVWINNFFFITQTSEINNFFWLILLCLTNKNYTRLWKTTYEASCCLSHRSFRRSPAGPKSSFGPGLWAGRSTFLSSLRHFLPPTERELRVQRAEPLYTPSWFLFFKLRYLLRTFGLCFLHVLN